MPLRLQFDSKSYSVRSQSDLEAGIDIGNSDRIAHCDEIESIFQLCDTLPNANAKRRPDPEHTERFLRSYATTRGRRSTLSHYCRCLRMLADRTYMAGIISYLNEWRALMRTCRDPAA